MSNTETAALLASLISLRQMREELDAEISAAEDQIKAEMVERGEDTLTAGGITAAWKTVTSSRFDSTAFKKAMPELAAQYMKPTTTSRFTIR